MSNEHLLVRGDGLDEARAQIRANLARLDAELGVGDAEAHVKPVRFADNEWLATLVKDGETIWEGSTYRSQSEAENAARDQLRKIG